MYKTKKIEDIEYEQINTKQDIGRISQNIFDISQTDNQRRTVGGRQTEFFSLNWNSTGDNIGLNKFRYTVERNDENRKTYYVKRGNSLLKDMRNGEDNFVFDKNMLMRDNSSLEKTYSLGLKLRESKNDFKVFRVNEEYMSSQPRKIDVVYQN